MKPDADERTEGFGLLACGSSGHWRVDLDESGDGTAWLLELDGPQVYLTFAVRNLEVVREALNYLRSRREEVLPIGNFGSASVAFHWDNEDFPRCFLIVGPDTHSVVRISLSAEDTRSLGEALEQVIEDLPTEGGTA